MKQKSLESTPMENSQSEIDRLLSFYDRFLKTDPKELTLSERLDYSEVARFISSSSHMTNNEYKARLKETHNELSNIKRFSDVKEEHLAQLTPLEEFRTMQTIYRLKRDIPLYWYNSVKSFFEQVLQIDMTFGENLDKLEERFGFRIYELDEFLKRPKKTKKQIFSQYPELRTILERFKIKEYQKLKKTDFRVKQHLGKRFKQNPEDRKAIIRALDASGEFKFDDTIDWLIRIKKDETERVDWKNLYKKYEHEQYTYAGTPYSSIRSFLHLLKPKPNDVVYDLGCGLGRVCIYGALTTDAQYKGVEIIEERVNEANRIKGELGLKNVEFIQENVKKLDYSDGDIFFLYNPFTDETLKTVVDRLKEIAEKKNIIIVSYCGKDTFFKCQNWLYETTPRIGFRIFSPLRIFESK